MRLFILCGGGNYRQLFLRPRAGSRKELNKEEYFVSYTK
jgi:hypothetical protein